MKSTVIFGGKSYETEFDYGVICAALIDLGIGPERSVRMTAATVVAYAVTHKIKSAYALVSAAERVTPTCIASHIRRGLENAVYNGRLKNIDDYFGCSFYDYENGFGTKEFVAVMAEYLTQNGLLIVSLRDLTA